MASTLDDDIALARTPDDDDDPYPCTYVQLWLGSRQCGGHGKADP